MLLSTFPPFARLLLFFVLTHISIHQAVGQSVGMEQEIFIASDENSNAFDRFVGIHVTPTKIIAGELPIAVAVRLSKSWVLEAGAGPAFRDRVAEKLFDGNALQLLSFQNSSATYESGCVVYVGARYLIGGNVLQGFYITPELSYTHRNALYPTHQGVGHDYNGSIRSADARIMLGYDRAMCPNSEHLFYGGFIGFGMRRYAADYYTSRTNADPGSRHDVAAIPTLHFGYRVGFKL